MGCTPGGENLPLKGIEAPRRRGSSLRDSIQCTFGEIYWFPSWAQRCRVHSSARGYQLVLFASGEWATELVSVMIILGWGHQKQSVPASPDSPDYLRDQSDRGKSIHEEIGPFAGQHILVLRKVSLAVRVVFWGKEVEHICVGVQTYTYVCRWSIHSSEGKSSQVTFIYIALLTIQIVTNHCTISK